MSFRKAAWVVGILGLGFCLWACSPSPTPSPSPTSSPNVKTTPTSALDKAVDFLLQARSPDGGWHSTKYRDMAEGPEITPYVLKALTYSNLDKADRRPSEEYLESFEPGKTELIYPVYTSAGMLLNRVDDSDEWKSFLLSFQADEDLGWTDEDPSYGGWSYAMTPPRKTQGEIPTLSQANLPSTLFALGGLSLSKDGLPEDVARRALVFLQRCQNYPDGDGGFCASPSDESMNKAGAHRSYGSATSDGLRALLRCGLKPDHPRVVAARRWTEEHLSTTTHPGDFPEGRFYDRDSLYFYYCWSTAHALAALQRSGVELSEREQTWKKESRTQLISKQRPDGSWVNPASATREDEPLVSTPMAMAVLVLTE
jgi:hypothetical protein